MKFTDYSVCVCGATTIFDERGASYSTKNTALLPARYKNLRRLQDSYCCDYCVNHYGLELCGCGSGELFGECENGLPECAMPMQVLEGYDHVVGKASWMVA